MPDQVQAQAAPVPPQTAAVPQTGGGLQVGDLQAAVQVLADLVAQLPDTAPEPAPVATPDPSPAAVRTIAPAGTRLRSSRLWTTVGSILAVGGGQFAGLPPLSQICITALAGLYIIMRTYKGGQ